MNTYRLIYPDYRGGCIADVPCTAAELLGIGMQRYLDDETVKYDEMEEFDNVVVVVVDGLGKKLLEERIPEDSVFDIEDFSTIDAVYPSTTAAGITSLNTGLEPVEHGLIEWEVWEEGVGKVVQPLKSSDLEEEPVSMENYFEGKSIYKTLSEKGVGCHVFQPDKIVDSEFSKVLTDGAERHGYSNLCDLSVNLSREIKEAEGKNYFYVYIGDVDELSHRYGPGSEQTGLQIEHVFCILEDFVGRLDGGSDTCLMITADHGQSDVSEGEFVDINSFDRLWEEFKEGEEGKIPPTGGPRDMFLSVKNPRKAKKVVRKYFGEVSDVYDVEELVNTGFFGEGRPSKLFRQRTGDMIVLPRGNRMMFYSENHEHLSEMRGMHGGVSEREMRVPLFVGSVENIKKKKGR